MYIARSSFVFFLMSLVVALGPGLIPFHTTHAQSPRPTINFGQFEVLDQLPISSGTIDKNISDFANKERPLVTVANFIFQIGLAILVMVGVIIVVIGGYKYMTAGGDGKKIEEAKKWILGALAGIAVGMVGWLILNTVSSQFTDPAEPKIIVPSPTI
jgi:hypothetical protein